MAPIFHPLHLPTNILTFPPSLSPLQHHFWISKQPNKDMFIFSHWLPPVEMKETKLIVCTLYWLKFIKRLFCISKGKKDKILQGHLQIVPFSPRDFLKCVLPVYLTHFYLPLSHILGGEGRGVTTERLASGKEPRPLFFPCPTLQFYLIFTFPS